MGAIFIRVNNHVNAYRKKLLNTKGKKILEGLALTAVTVTIMYMAVTINYWAAGDKYETDDHFC